MEESCEMERVHKRDEVKGDVYAIKGTITSINGSIDGIKKSQKK
ncbi:hypothetical protein ACU82A_31505 [Bacillus cereus]